MAIITITAITTGPELVSGIPRFVSLSTNIPATIFYTIDGTEPTSYSSVYLEPINIPTDQNSVRLRALAISGSDSGTLDVKYNTSLNGNFFLRNRQDNDPGIVVDDYGEDSVLLDGYSPNENGIVNVPSRYSDYQNVDLDIQYSETGPSGIGEGTLIQLGPIVSNKQSVSFERSSPNDQNVYFNPRSLYIVIDGRKGYDDQSTFIVNNAYSDNRDMVKYYGGRDLKISRPYIAGGLVRTFYSVKPDGTGVSCSYYFNSNENRWIKSIQNYNPATVPKTGATLQNGQPLVFKWIYNKYSRPI